MKTVRHLPGAPCWAELVTPDVELALAFYRDLFRWDGATGLPYVTLTLRQELIGAMKRAADGEGAVWDIYFTSEDLAATSQAVEQAGGRVVAPASQVFDRGSAAYYLAPDGAGFGAWQPNSRAGVGLMREPGALSWFELATPEPEHAVSFYTDVFGWTSTKHAHGNSSYIDLEAPGAAIPFGGITSRAADAIPIQWTPYFTAHDADAAASRAADLGGSVITAPATLNNVGRLATLRDPQGAVFAAVSRPGSSYLGV